jgi:hypothetical protein
MLALSRPHHVPLYAETLASGTKVYTDIVNTKYAQQIDICVFFGDITGDDVVVTLEECDDVTPTHSTALASWKYRLTSAIGTDSMGAVSSSSSTAATGLTQAASGGDDRILIISVDPSALTSGYPFVRVAFDPGASASDVDIMAWAEIWPRYEEASASNLA